MCFGRKVNFENKKILEMKRTICFSILLIVTGMQIHAQNWDMAKSAGGIGHEGGNGIRTDTQGNIFVSGYFSSDTIFFGAEAIISKGGGDVFIVKYNPSGDVLWAKSAGGPLDESVAGICIDQKGNSYITGYFASDTIIFEGQKLAGKGNWDIFTAKYDGSGNLLWAKNAGGSGYETGDAISLDTLGNCYITGHYNGPSFVMGSDLIAASSSNDMFVAKYDSSGNVIWAHGNGGSGDDYARGITTDPEGSTYITGSFNSPSLIFGADTLFSSGSNDIFILKYSSVGNRLWAKRFGGSQGEVGNRIMVSKNGLLTLTGMFNGSLLPYGNDTLYNTANVSFDIFVAQNDTAGNVIWAKSIGSNGNDYGFGLDVAGNGSFYLTGWYTGNILTIGDDTLTNQGSGDIFVAKFDNIGNPLWGISEAHGSTNLECSLGICLDAIGNVYITGYFMSPEVTFGSSTLINAGSEDFFLAKLVTLAGIEDENNAFSAMMVFPNPACDKLTIKNPTPHSNTQISVYDLNGRLLLQQPFTSEQTEIDVGRLAKGMYLIKLTDDTSFSTMKFLKE
jgi:hypothetical protein